MTIRADIYRGEPIDYIGWVEVDPFDYEYTGPDPDGEISAYLSAIADGSIEFSWSPEVDKPQSEYPPEFTLLDIRQTLHGFDEIWLVKTPDSFDPESVDYE